MLNIKTFAAALLLSGLTALPCLAQTKTWSGSDLILNGGTIQGCNVQLVSATHTGTTNNVIRITFQNAGANAVRVKGEVHLTGNGQSMVSPQFSVAMYPNVSAWTRGGNPFEGSLAGTTLTVNVRSCQSLS